VTSSRPAKSGDGTGEEKASSKSEATPTTAPGQIHLPDLQYVGPVTDLPLPPADLPYPEYDDWFNRELLIANGIQPDETEIAQALKTQEGLLLSAAAHSSYAFPGLAAPLRDLVEGADEDAAVEAAYSLARQGDNVGRGALREAMTLPLGPYLSPILAAGRLARLGDRSGEPVIQAGLTSEYLATRMLSCKQLFLYAPIDRDANSSVDAVSEWSQLVRLALADDEPAIQREILMQLQFLRCPAIAPLVHAYLQRAEDPALVARARDVLAALDLET